MKRYDDISLLVDRFLDGVTNLAEERRLDEFFMSHEAELGEMPEHLQIAAEMFRELRTLNEGKLTACDGDGQFHQSTDIGSRFAGWSTTKSLCFTKRRALLAIAAAACLLLFFVLYSPNDVNPRLEENTLQVAELPAVALPDIINVQQTEVQPTDGQIIDVPKNKPVKKQTKLVGTKPNQDNKTSAPDINDIHYDVNEIHSGPTVQNGNAMLCGYNPGANMLPMHTDVTMRAVMTECEMAILEEEFQISERSRQTIEI